MEPTSVSAKPGIARESNSVDGSGTHCRVDENGGKLGKQALMGLIFVSHVITLHTKDVRPVYFCCRHGLGLGVHPGTPV